MKEIGVSLSCIHVAIRENYTNIAVYKERKIRSILLPNYIVGYTDSPHLATTPLHGHEAENHMTAMDLLHPFPFGRETKFPMIAT